MHEGILILAPSKKQKSYAKVKNQDIALSEILL